jgi:hypothetical protein
MKLLHSTAQHRSSAVQDSTAPLQSCKLAHTTDMLLPTTNRSLSHTKAKTPSTEWTAARHRTGQRMGADYTHKSRTRYNNTHHETDTPQPILITHQVCCSLLVQLALKCRCGAVCILAKPCVVCSHTWTGCRHTPGAHSAYCTA